MCYMYCNVVYGSGSVSSATPARGAPSRAGPKRQGTSPGCQAGHQPQVPGNVSLRTKPGVFRNDSHGSVKYAGLQSNLVKP